MNIPVLFIEFGRNSEEKGQGAVYLKCWDSVFEVLKKMVGHVTSPACFHQFSRKVSSTSPYEISVVCRVWRSFE